MVQRPRFKPHLRIEVVPGAGLFVLSERQQTVLQGRLYELIAPQLDGRSVEEVCADLRGRATAAEVHFAIGRLEKKGYLTDLAATTAPALSPAEAAFWSDYGVDPATAAARLSSTTIELCGLGDVDLAPVRGILTSFGLREGSAENFRVALVDSYLRDGLRTINRQALTSERPWLLAKPVGGEVWVGPLFRPGATGCWECMAERIRRNAPLAAYLDDHTGRDGRVTAAVASTPATVAVATGLIGNAIAAWAVRREIHHLDATVFTFDFATGRAQTHKVVRHPSCPACGREADPLRPLDPLILRPSPKAATDDGGHRTVTPDQTLRTYGHHVSPITGAVPLLEQGTVDPDGILHVYVSGHNAARRSRSIVGLRNDLRSSNAGKGVTALQAKAGALCEGLERYSGVFRGDERRRRARLVDLGDKAIHPHDCLQFSERQYRDRDAWNGRGSRFDQVPVPFDPHARVEWTPVWSLTQDRIRYLPTALCYFDYPQDHDAAFCWASSNGNAAGNTLEEAILQGFLELVERDAVALWWYTRASVPGVCLDSFDDPYLGKVRACLARRRREVWLLDVTSDLGIPAVVAVSRRTDGRAEHLLFGFGAHLDARLAALRAVTELVQMLGHVRYDPAEQTEHTVVTDADTLDWLSTATVDNQPHVRPRAGPPRTGSEFQSCRTKDIRDDIHFCRHLVEGFGLEFLVLDQTRPEIGLPVAKVVVPGLRHFWPRFAPGRLYDVPVKLGWLAEPLPETRLNPIPMFL